MHRIIKRKLDPIRCIIIHKDGRITITNNVRLFGSDEILEGQFQFAEKNQWKNGEYWLKEMRKNSAIYREV